MGGLAYEVAEPTYVSFHSRSEVKWLTGAMNGRIHGFTFLELLETLEGNLKLVGGGEVGRVVEDFNPKK